MKAEIRGLYSPDLGRDEIPTDPADAHFPVQALMGPLGGEGEESFEFTVVTRSALDRLGLPRWGRGLLVIESFSWEAVEEALQKLLRQCTGQDWEQVATSLNRFLCWEFDEYQE